jgi:archaemetzincin
MAINRQSKATSFAVRAALGLLICVVLSACSTKENPTAANTAVAKGKDKKVTELRADIKKIEPFFKPMGKPKPYDWLASHNEPGQTFDEYINSNPTLPTAERKTIYVLPLGKFTAQQKKIIDITSGYLEAFYGLPVKEMPQQDLKHPSDPKDSRTGGYLKGSQIRTGYILDSILTPKLPQDAAAFIALTNEDLFPDVTMNYVFGQASLENRVGVWSLSRLSQSADYNTFLLRTLKIAAHETGHMFGMRHCTKYECLMSGTNYLGETDSRPIDACPECMAKICWISDVSPQDRYERLAAFCRKNGLINEADEFQQKADTVK